MIDEVHNNIETKLTSIAMHDSTKFWRQNNKINKNKNKQNKKKQQQQEEKKDRKLVAKGSTKCKIGGFK